MWSAGERSTPAPTESRGLIALLGFAVSIRTVCASRGRAQRSRLSAQGVFQDKNRRASGMSCPGTETRGSFAVADFVSELYLPPNCRWSVPRVFHERLQICTEKVVDGPAGVVVIPFLHHLSGLTEGLEVCGFRRANRGEEE